jgi:hypothetical protein
MPPVAVCSVVALVWVGAVVPVWQSEHTTESVTPVAWHERHPFGAVRCVESTRLWWHGLDVP